MKECRECKTKNGCAVELCPAKLDAVFVKDVAENEIKTKTKMTQNFDEKRL